jgi:capsular polysaccharide biosynthesis protein
VAVTERPRTREPLDLEAEQEVEFRRYWNAITARWWLPVLGLVLGILGGYALAIGGGDVYRAEATLYLGQPFSPSGAPVPGLATNPSTVNEIVRSENVLQDVADRSGMNLSNLRANISSRQVSPPAGRRAVVGQTPLIEVSVTGQNARTATRAANLLAQEVVEDISPYVEAKITAIRERIEANELELADSQRRLDLAQRELDAILSDRGLGGTDRLVAVTNLNAQIGSLIQQRGLATQNLLEAKEALALAEEVEAPRVVEQAAARKTTARSVGRSVVVGALIGLILGTLAAILWEPGAARFRRRLA